MITFVSMSLGRRGFLECAGLEDASGSRKPWERRFRAGKPLRSVRVFLFTIILPFLGLALMISSFCFSLASSAPLSFPLREVHLSLQLEELCACLPSLLHLFPPCLQCLLLLYHLAACLLSLPSGLVRCGNLRGEAALWRSLVRQRFLALEIRDDPVGIAEPWTEKLLVA